MDCPWRVFQSVELFAQHQPVACSDVLPLLTGADSAASEVDTAWFLLSQSICLPSFCFLTGFFASLLSYCHYCHCSLKTVHSSVHSTAAVPDAFYIFPGGRFIFVLALCTIVFTFIFAIVPFICKYKKDSFCLSHNKRGVVKVDSISQPHQVSWRVSSSQSRHTNTICTYIK